MLHTFWRKLTGYNSGFGWVLILLFGIPRFILVLIANQTQRYGSVSFIFLFMWIAPFIFLTKEGRKFIGIRRPTHYFWLPVSLLIGVVCCAAVYGLGVWLFDHTNSNWFVYISRSYPQPQGNETVYFLIYAITGMTVSPVGEEFLYRGVIHGSFSAQYGETKASIIDSLAFAVTHLAHFGIVFISGSWTFLLLPALLWVLCMFGAGRLFYYCKQKTGSLLGAILCHAGFNLAMTWFIFYFVFYRTA